MYYIYYLLNYFYLLFTVNLVCCLTAATAYAARHSFILAFIHSFIRAEGHELCFAILLQRAWKFISNYLYGWA